MHTPLIPGSQDHKERFCHFFLDTHLAFELADLSWPTLDGDSLERLRRLPFWADALATERATACIIQARAQLERDPLIREALALQGSEERRHAAILQALMACYDIAVPEQAEPQPPADAEWAFLCTGYSECFDAFFSFTLLALAQESGFFPAELVAIFDPILQEEARHILFFVNWEAYQRACAPSWQRPRHLWRGVYGRGLQMWYRLQMARGIRGQGDFTLKGHYAWQSDLTPRRFLERCLQENDRRLQGYDPRLLRPWLVPWLARTLCRVLP